MLVDVELIDTIAVGNTLGEGVLWRASDETLWWTDIQERTLFKMSWSEKSLQTYDLPERLGSFGFVAEDDTELICAFESGFAYFSPEANKCEWIYRPPDLGAGVRLNDGRVGPDGSFWAGSMIESVSGAAQKSGLYRLSEDIGCLMIEGLEISNGIAWSPLGDELYFSDSKKKKIYRSRLPINRAGHNSNGRTIFAEVADGAPDGANVDSAGRYWSAIWGAGLVNCYLPDGTLLQSLQVPALQPTCISFGGARNNLMFVSSAKEGLSADQLRRYPESGHLFVYRTNTTAPSTFRYFPCPGRRG